MRDLSKEKIGQVAGGVDYGNWNFITNHDSWYNSSPVLGSIAIGVVSGGVAGAAAGPVGAAVGAGYGAIEGALVGVGIQGLSNLIDAGNDLGNNLTRGI